MLHTTSCVCVLLTFCFFVDCHRLQPTRSYLGHLVCNTVRARLLIPHVQACSQTSRAAARFVLKKQIVSNILKFWFIWFKWFKWLQLRPVKNLSKSVKKWHYIVKYIVKICQKLSKKINSGRQKSVKICQKIAL